MCGTGPVHDCVPPPPHTHTQNLPRTHRRAMRQDDSAGRHRAADDDVPPVQGAGGGAALEELLVGLEVHVRHQLLLLGFLGGCWCWLVGGAYENVCFVVCVWAGGIVRVVCRFGPDCIIDSKPRALDATCLALARGAFDE